MYELKSMTMSDGHISYYHAWTDVNKNCDKKINMFIVHGMAEHSLRYDEFATFLNNNGIAVYALDLRGFGKTGEGKERGWYAEKNGWMRTALDVIELVHDVKSTQPTSVAVLFGHSMGSYLSRQIISSFPNEFALAIICGTGTPGAVIRIFGRPLTRFEKFRIGAKTPSKLMNKLSFGSFNKPFEKETDNPTGFEWLNRDQNEVKKFIDDPDCGDICTASFFYDFIKGMCMATSNKAVHRVNKDIPLFFISGDKDPVGSYGKGVIKAASSYKKAGVKSVNIKLYPNARHELIVELCKDEVFNDVLSFIKSNV